LNNFFLYQHSKRAEWGYGAVTDTKDDRTTFKFDDGTTRTITHAHMHMMVQVQLEEPEATEVCKRIAKPARSPESIAKKAAAAKKKAATKRAAAAEPVAEEQPS